MRCARPLLASSRPLVFEPRAVIGFPPMLSIPSHRSRAFCGVVDALDGLTSDEKRRVLGAVLELVPAAAPAIGSETSAAFADIERRVQAAATRRVMHCSTCRKAGHDRRSCPERLRQLAASREQRP